MLNKIKREQKGFTIIEVLIVLAIAGLIMLIVFLAVPALQRTQRNNARKNDASRVGASATEFTSNNNGRLPTTAADLTTLRNQIGTLSQYTVSTDLSLATGTKPAVTSLTSIVLVTSAQCSTTTAGATTGGTSRQMSVQFATEAGSGTPIGVCIGV